MDYKNFDGDRFPFSKERSRVEYYKCFYDPSKLEPIKGKELLKLEEHDEKYQEKRPVWLFFYQPHDYEKILGKVQRDRIENLEEQVHKLERGKELNTTLLQVSVFVGMLSVVITFGSNLIYLAIIPFFYAFTRYFENDGISKEIREKKSFIDELKSEISCLLEQQEEMLGARLEGDEIVNKFWGDIVEIESGYLEDAGEPENKTPSFYDEVFKASGEYPMPAPENPVVPSWGLLQSSLRSNAGTSSHQRTGLRLAANDIGAHVSSWRSDHVGKPMFRVWYVHFLFFHNKNLSLLSFYYDLITEKLYSEQIETYQYNHITNYSYNDEDLHYMDDDPVIKKYRSKIPLKLTSHIFGDQVKTSSLSSASGLNARCVVPDFEVEIGMNRWLEFRESKLAEKLGGEEFDSEVMKANFKKELFKEIKSKRTLLDTLAWLSFKELRARVAKFALVDEYDRD